MAKEIKLSKTTNSLRESLQVTIKLSIFIKINQLHLNQELLRAHSIKIHILIYF
jgi:hypothetical protein